MTDPDVVGKGKARGARVGIAAAAAGGGAAATAGWGARDSAELYGVGGWGAEYFGVSAGGEVVVRRGGEGDEGVPPVEVSLFDLVRDVRRSRMEAPVLFRFPHVLESRLRQLNTGFRDAVARSEFRGRYRGVFPVKVNQQAQVLEEVTTHGRPFHHGLEVGSKPELLAALAYLRDREALLVCNGYKDAQFIELALRARKMGLDVVIVLEMPHELDTIMAGAEALGIEPAIGVRVKLSTESGGHWTDSSGEQSPFGLNTSQLIETVDRLRSAGKLGWLKMLHCHQGSQVPDLGVIASGVQEAAWIYSGLVDEGAPMGLLNLGGGLAVDYDGTRSATAASANYTIADYCAAVVDNVKAVADSAGVPHPDLVTESGRAVTAHYSVLVVKTLDVNRAPAAAPAGGDAPGQNSYADVLRGLAEISSEATAESNISAARTVRLDYLTAFARGELGLRDRAAAERAYWEAIGSIASASALTDEEAGPALKSARSSLADRYYANFSVFQSLADAWAIGQLFPVMPIHRLAERPGRGAVLNDVTCDCDGKLRHYVSGNGHLQSLPLHDPVEGEDYFIGVFLVGAYQETLSDLHNLFGDTHAVSVELLDDGSHRLTHEVAGDTVADVLGYVEHDTGQLVQRFNEFAGSTVARGDLTADEAEAAARAFRDGMASYTYYDG